MQKSENSLAGAILAPSLCIVVMRIGEGSGRSSTLQLKFYDAWATFYIVFAARQFGIGE